MAKKKIEAVVESAHEEMNQVNQAGTPVKEIKDMTKDELRAYAEAKATELNDCIQEGRYADAEKVRACIEDAVNTYTNLVRTECFNALKATENPMIEAVKQPTYQTIKVRESKVGEGKVKVSKWIIEDATRQIDLLKLHKHVGGDGIGADKHWFYIVEKLNMLLTAQKCIDLGIDPKAVNDSYAMQDISKQKDLGKDPTSNTNILKTLTVVVQSMIGTEYKPTSHDVKYLMSVYSKKNNRKALTVTCANHKYMRMYMMDVCHHIVTGTPYGVEFKTK